MTERFSMVVREWRSAEVMNDYVFRGINQRNLPRREREGEKFLHHLNFVRVSGINIHRFHRSNLQRACNGTRNEIYFFWQNGIVTGNRLWNSQKLVPFFLRWSNREIFSLKSLLLKRGWIFFSFYLVFVISIVITDLFL